MSDYSKNSSHRRKRRSKHSHKDFSGEKISSETIFFWAFLFLIFLASIAYWALNLSDAGSEDSPLSDPSITEYSSDPLDPDYKTALENSLSALEIAQAFTQEEDPEKRLKWCRHPEETKLLLSQFSPEALTEIPVEVTPMQGIITTSTGLLFHRFVATFANGNQRLIAIVFTKEGLQVDWETYARYGTASWSNILQAQVAEATVRVFIRKVNYYNYRYIDEDIWEAFEISSPDIEVPIYAYSKRKSDLTRMLSKISDLQRITLTIRLDESIKNHQQCQITDLLALGWALSDDKPRLSDF